jgi:hypothetical protein
MIADEYGAGVIILEILNVICGASGIELCLKNEGYAEGKANC